MTPEPTRSLPIFCMTRSMPSNTLPSLYMLLKELFSAYGEKGC